MSNILFLGHSLVARRQWSFAYALINAGAELVFYPPKKWGRNIYEGPVHHNIVVGLKGNIWSYQYGTEWLEQQIDLFEPEWIGGYVEPYSMAAVEIQSVASKKNIKSFFFAYENLATNINGMPKNLKDNMHIIEEADKILCGNAGALNFMRHFGADNPVKLPHTGVETDLFKMETERPSSDVKECVFVGRDVPEKNWKLVEQMIKISEDHENGKMTVYRPDKFIPDNKMATVYNRGKILLHTSIRIPTWKEQLGFVVAEALSCQLGVIHSVEGDNMQWFANFPGTELADPRNPWDYYHKLDKVIDQYPNKKGRERIVKSFSNKVIAKKWLEVLR